MNNDEFLKFTGIWVAASDVYNINLTDAAVTLAFKVLQKYEFNEISNAVASYLGDPQNGRFAPKPADIVKQIQEMYSNDGRPNADEAWSIAIKSFDEYETVILNNEIAKALEFARGIYLDGDKTGARMAFRASYDKALTNARANKEPLKWWASLGHDQQSREPALRDAVVKGLLPATYVNQFLPAPITEEGRLAIAKVKEQLMISNKDA